jgi:hypothetical protein
MRKSILVSLALEIRSAGGIAAADDAEIHSRAPCIDLESIMRSVPLWRSDTSCSPGHPDWNQIQTYGLALFIPLSTACVWTPQGNECALQSIQGASP